MEYECPVCGEWIELGDFQIQGTCLDCQSSFIVDRDGEFFDGSWHDRTRLLVTSNGI
jgi:hypothetical protein